ncbi:MAG: peptidylprolyl isomerase [Xanthomonadales bacterium]|nr:peptidylprolyl isomerase [Xanthomonadales bacterium]
MNVAENTVVSFNYRTTADGAEVDSSTQRGGPLTVLVGHGGIIPGLEKALLGRAAGDRFEVSIPPAEAYGERRPGLAQRVPKKYFRNPAQLRPGMMTALQNRDGGRQMVVVTKVGSSVVDVDLNHPFAGRTLDFEIEVTDVREATPEERAHGHAHGPGGHEH